ncbi:MAG: glycosyl hydrolase family 65 protein [Pseudomonadota bacterium]
MGEWEHIQEGYEPSLQARRETLTTLGNGYVATRGAWCNASADGIHYPGTYLAGGYGRLRSQIDDHEIENEDLVNLPNWLVLVLRLDDGPWLTPAVISITEYRQVLSLRDGYLSRMIRIAAPDGRKLQLQEERLVSMDDPHIAAIKLTVTPEGWSGRATLRSAIDGGVTNAGVPRYAALASRHLRTLETVALDAETVLLRTQIEQSRREIVLAARTRLFAGHMSLNAARTVVHLPDLVAQDIALELADGRPVSIEKVVAIHTERDTATSEPRLAAVDTLARAGDVATLRAAHSEAWADLWSACSIEIQASGDADVQATLNLHLFHLLQTVSVHSVDLDIGIPPRGWTGEAYRGHIMWDELFIFPFLSLRQPVLARALLLYRYRRLGAARRAAREAGLRGAMFPWQSGSDGREESQRIHLNPVSGRWVPDVSSRQRHIGAAVAFNVWQHWEVTRDREFLHDYGAELMFSIAQFFSSLARWEAREERFSIAGVMGPDEFHTGTPDAKPGTETGLTDNAYTNAMVSWLMARALDVLAVLPPDRAEALCRRLRIDAEERRRWDDISRTLALPIMEGGIIAQFRGYEALAEFDWEGYEARYGAIERLDRILENEGANPNAYRLSKQADVLMLFYLFSAEELDEIFRRLGYAFEPSMIFSNIHYYIARTSHGSTLSWITHAWVMARADRSRSWALFRKALDSDVSDLQGGTTREGIHLGAMAGTIDMVQRCWTGLEPRANVLTLNPCLPHEVDRLRTTVRYRGHTLDIEVTQELLRVSSRPFTEHPITIAYRGHVREMSPGQHFEFALVGPRESDRRAKAHDRAALTQHDRAKVEHGADAVLPVTEEASTEPLDEALTDHTRDPR